uniref:Galectin n=1 Tax=Amphiprion percula TaxID=161767 RepID=A0A3P8RP07_AMPPE
MCVLAGVCGCGLNGVRLRTETLSGFQQSSFCLQLSGELRLQKGRMNFNLGDAVDNQGGPWPEQPKHPAWPGQPSGNSLWPGENKPQTIWQGGGGNPDPAWNSPTPRPSGPGGWSNPYPGPGPGGWSNPSPGPGPAPPRNVFPQQNLTVPHHLNLPHGAYDKLLITIAGTVKPGADKFTLDFLTSSGDLAFHFNPRFNEQGKKVIVRNTLIGQKWGKEERELSRFPFVQGQSFEIKILCTNTEFKVAVNNSHLLEYRYRRDINPRNITKLSIYNDITLSKVTTETMP